MKSHWPIRPSFVQSTYISTCVGRGIRKPLGANSKESSGPQNDRSFTRLGNDAVYQPWTIILPVSLLTVVAGLRPIIP
ncbi:hypothetical protein BDV40DRAFT_264991 [Aspergillus tamarii]|uniref:Uncharacterized protein n=1 Tax=Aspergillus tamarii TaxID=41984 RepID=A0A5N6UVC5_ASPTM|nr:hypothetical protein BDV40DRAFT_264991 [Aspergillus tamarii]